MIVLKATTNLHSLLNTIRIFLLLLLLLLSTTTSSTIERVCRAHVKQPEDPRDAHTPVTSVGVATATATAPQSPTSTPPAQPSEPPPPPPPPLSPPPPPPSSSSLSLSKHGRNRSGTPFVLLVVAVSVKPTPTPFNLTAAPLTRTTTLSPGGNQTNQMDSDNLYRPLTARYMWWFAIEAVACLLATLCIETIAIVAFYAQHLAVRGGEAVRRICRRKQPSIDHQSRPPLQQQQLQSQVPSHRPQQVVAARVLCVYRAASGVDGIFFLLYSLSATTYQHYELMPVAMPIPQSHPHQHRSQVESETKRLPNQAKWHDLRTPHSNNSSDMQVACSAASSSYCPCPSPCSCSCSCCNYSSCCCYHCCCCCCCCCCCYCYCCCGCGCGYACCRTSCPCWCSFCCANCSQFCCFHEYWCRQCCQRFQWCCLRDNTTYIPSSSSSSSTSTSTSSSFSSYGYTSCCYSHCCTADCNRAHPEARADTQSEGVTPVRARWAEESRTERLARQLCAQLRLSLRYMLHATSSRSTLLACKAAMVMAAAIRITTSHDASSTTAAAVPASNVNNNNSNMINSNNNNSNNNSISNSNDQQWKTKHLSKIFFNNRQRHRRRRRRRRRRHHTSVKQEKQQQQQQQTLGLMSLAPNSNAHTTARIERVSQIQAQVRAARIAQNVSESRASADIGKCESIREHARITQSEHNVRAADANIRGSEITGQYENIRTNIELRRSVKDASIKKLRRHPKAGEIFQINEMRPSAEMRRDAKFIKLTKIAKEPIFNENGYAGYAGNARNTNCKKVHDDIIKAKKHTHNSFRLSALRTITKEPLLSANSVELTTASVALQIASFLLATPTRRKMRTRTRTRTRMRMRMRMRANLVWLLIGLVWFEGPRLAHCERFSTTTHTSTTMMKMNANALTDSKNYTTDVSSPPPPSPSPPPCHQSLTSSNADSRRDPRSIASGSGNGNGHGNANGSGSGSGNGNGSGRGRGSGRTRGTKLYAPETGLRHHKASRLLRYAEERNAAQSDYMRLESIKRQILSRLGLSHKPNVTHPLPKQFIWDTIYRAEDIANQQRQQQQQQQQQWQHHQVQVEPHGRTSTRRQRLRLQQQQQPADSQSKYNSNINSNSNSNSHNQYGHENRDERRKQVSHVNNNKNNKNSSKYPRQMAHASRNEIYNYNNANVNGNSNRNINVNNNNNNPNNKLTYLSNSNSDRSSEVIYYHGTMHQHPVHAIEQPPSSSSSSSSSSSLPYPNPKYNDDEFYGYDFASNHGEYNIHQTRNGNANENFHENQHEHQNGNSNGNSNANANGHDHLDGIENSNQYSSQNKYASHHQQFAEGDAPEEDLVGGTQEIISFAERGNLYRQHHLVEFPPQSDELSHQRLFIRKAIIHLRVDRATPRKQQQQQQQHRQHYSTEQAGRRATSLKKLKIWIFQVLERNYTGKNFDEGTRFCDSFTVDTRYLGWQKFDLTETVRRWYAKLYAHTTTSTNTSGNLGGGVTDNEDNRLRLLIDCTGCGTQFVLQLFDNPPAKGTAAKTVKAEQRRGSHRPHKWPTQYQQESASKYESEPESELHRVAEVEVPNQLIRSFRTMHNASVAIWMEDSSVTSHSDLSHNHEGRTHSDLNSVKNQTQYQQLNPYRPFLVLHTETKRLRRVRRRAIDCMGAMHGQCCKESFYVSFKALGWDDWIIAPRGYFANYCRGDCTGPFRTPDTFQTFHAHFIEEYRKMGLLNGMQPCCAPVKFSSMSLIYYGDDGIIKRDLPKMVVDECGCP